MEFGVTTAGMAAGNLINEIYKTVDRTVTIYINNDLERVLENPTIHTLNGELYTIAADVKPQTQATVIFRKTPLSPTGLVGAIAYTIRGTHLKATVYFENPSIGSRMFGVRWYHTETEIEKSHLKEGKRERYKMWQVGDKLSNREQESDGFVVKVFMNNSNHAQMNITFTANGDDSDEEGSDGYDSYGIGNLEDHYQEYNTDYQQGHYDGYSFHRL